MIPNDNDGLQTYKLICNEDAEGQYMYTQS